MLEDYIDKETKKAVGIILASVLIFNSLPKLEFFGKYFQEQPIITLLVGVGILFLVFKEK